MMSDQYPRPENRSMEDQQYETPELISIVNTHWAEDFKNKSWNYFHPPKEALSDTTTDNTSTPQP